MKARWLLVVLGLTAFFAVSCATDVGTIDRTQHERLAKKQFAGVWYMNQTVIDIPYSGAWSFVGEMNFGATGKVIFDIEEQFLIAYPTVEYVEGSEKKWHQQQFYKYWDDTCTTKEAEGQYQCVDGKDNLGQPGVKCCLIEMYVGQPVAMFSILSHYDVARRYNAQTGEQTNVLEENTTDKKWRQREYIRVNWAANKINDFTFMARIVNQSSLDYYVQSNDPTNPDAPTFTPDYFDVVTKSYGDPASTGACDVYGVSTGDCAPAVVKFRSAFRKVDPLQDYEPLRFHNEDRQSLFGYFLTERNAYDEDYGLTEAGKVSFINRWNIWDKTFEDTPVLVNGVAKACFKDLANTGCDTANVNGVKEFCQADTWFTSGKCVSRSPLPYSQRGLRPVVYHTSYDLPELMWNGSHRTAKSWSETLKDTVAWLYLWEERGRIIGQNQVRSCETDADCASSVLLDRFFDTTAASTVVALPEGRSVLVVDSGFRNDIAWKCNVRLINIAADRTFDLAVGSETPLQGVVALTGDSTDPANPAHASVASSSTNLTFSVTEFGSPVATLDAPCMTGTAVTIIYDGTRITRATANKADIKGVRVINLTGVMGDVSIQGGLRQYSVADGANTGYQGLAGTANSSTLPVQKLPQRLVLAPAGSRGDLTCYRSQSVGRCVGYDQPMTETDWTRLEEIKASMPEMFAVCRNTYTPAVTDGALNDDEWASPLFAPWVDIKNLSIDERNKLTPYSPCLDSLPGAKLLKAADKIKAGQAMKKIGDSRYSQIMWVSEAQFSSPLGYGPTAADPDSGQIFYGIANIYGAPLQTLGNIYRDLFDLMTGKLDTADYITGARIREYVASKDSGDQVQLPPIAASSLPAAAATVAPEVAAADKPLSSLAILNILQKAKIGDPVSVGLPVNSVGLVKQRLAALKGTKYEQMLMNDEMRYAMEQSGSASGSPLEWATLEDFNKHERERQIFLGQHNYCYGEFNDEGMIGMVQSWACIGNDTRPRCDSKTFDPLDQRNDTGSACCIDDGKFLADCILQRYYTAVVEHEIGHTMGLRHNFAASTDLFNFPDKYFSIRDKDTIPCSMTEECESMLGQTCQGGFCSLRKAETCSTAADCGYVGLSIPIDTFDCVGGKCVEITRCGIHGECPQGATCNGEDRVCYASGVRVDAPVVNENGGRLKAFAPRPGLTVDEARQSRTIYQVSSIMDYGQRWNSDILDLGKYDKAAIRFGYGALVDVYTDTSNIQKAMHTYYQTYGYDTEADASDNLDTAYWGGGIFFSQFFYLNNLIGEKANLAEGDYVRNRTAVPYDAMRYEHAMTPNFYRQNLDRTFIQVPYKFAGDEYNGNVGTYTWDTGVDALEIVHNMGIQLHDYYLMDAFKRERYGAGLHGDPIGYATRLQTRYMDPMRGCGMLYALYSHLLKNYSTSRGVWANSRMMGYGLRRASETGFEILASSMISPAPGSYKLNVDKNLFENVSYDQKVAGSDLDVPLGDGKYPYTTFWAGAGYFSWDHAAYYGAFWEKLAALLTLTDATVFFTTNYVGEQLNIGVGTSIGFNTMYSRQLTELFGSLVAEDPSIYAGSGTVGGQYARRQIFNPDNPDVYSVMPQPYFTDAAKPTGPRVAPSIDNITLKSYIMAYGMASLPASFDPSFLDSFTICLKGNGNCHDIGTGSGIVATEFADPFNGKIFVGWGPTYVANWYSPNVALLDKANAQKVTWESATGADKGAAETELRKTIEVLDMMRGIYEVYSEMKI